MSSNINLYVQTEYSLLSSLIRIKELPGILKNLGYDACSICDEQMYGVIKFYNACKENGIKPIIGEKVVFKQENYDSAILLYAMNNTGYTNLLKICSMKNLDKDNFTLEKLEGLTYGVICVIPGMENEIIKYYFNNAYDKANSLINKYKMYFKDLYLGIDKQTEKSRNSIDNLINFATVNGLKCVGLNRTCYLSDEDVSVYKVLRSIALNTKNYNISEEETKMAFLSSVEMELLFNNYPELLKNTLEIGNLCNVDIEFHKYRFPTYDIENSTEYLTDLCKIGLNKRLEQKAQRHERYDVNAYKNRLVYELNIIKKMGFVDYFLIVFDYVRYAKMHDICVGPGRGSAGGSLVSFSLGITEIDPIKYDLLFERFLNPERVSMPDIDVDFPDDKRDEVIRYIGERFGTNRVAHINTFGTLKARLAIRDVARVLNINDIKLKEVLKYVPMASNMSISALINEVDYIKKMMESDDEVNMLLNYALKIEGLPRNCSTHAAGIIMADKDLTYYTPLQEGINGLNQTQYEASDLEALGLVKMDVLGIRNLSIIKNVLNDVKDRIGIDININTIPLNDPKVMNMLRRGETLGIFQLESAGVRNLLMDLKCSSIDDIINATALYRPGPMDMIPTFIKRKFGERYELIHPDLKEILAPTYGIIVFQEQIMLIARKFAGYSLGEADMLRRAISKKKIDLMKKERVKFIESSVKNGYSEDKAIEIYNYIEKFANYGFNKSHAVAYALIAYQMAYLKTYYYKSFMSALMTNNIGSTDSILKYIRECKKEHINVLIPNINISSYKFVYDNKGIYYPLLGINNVGEVVVRDLLEERVNGPFKSFEDFVYRTSNILSVRQVNNLIYSGALDYFNHPRKAMVEQYDTVLQKVSYMSSLGNNLIETDYGDEEYTFEEICAYEKEALGFNLKFSQFVKYYPIKEKYHYTDLCDYTLGREEKSIAVIRYIKEIKTRKNDKMAFISMYDDSMEVEGVMFPTTYIKFMNILEINKAYVVSYKMENRNDKLQAVIESIYILQ